eukprot:COSAG06_NODE_5791_length_3272_cov_22.469587_3_plen_88_part_00
MVITMMIMNNIFIINDNMSRARLGKCDRVLLLSGRKDMPPQQSKEERRLENAYLSRRFILKIIVLPRQARDKHRESTQKERRFVTGG